MVRFFFFFKSSTQIELNSSGRGGSSSARNPQHNALALVLDTELDLWVNWTPLSRCSVNSTLVIAGKISLSFFPRLQFILWGVYGGTERAKIYYRRWKKVKISSSLLHNPFHSLHLSRELWRVEHEKRTTIKLRPRKMLLWKVYSFFFSLGFPFFRLHHPYSVYEHSLIMMQLARLWLQNDTVCARRPFLRSFFWDLDKSLVHISVECSFVFRPLFGSSCCNCTLFSHHKFTEKAHTSQLKQEHNVSVLAQAAFFLLLNMSSAKKK